VTALLVAVAGAGGALLRFAVDHLVRRRWSTVLPVGILLVNMTGAFALGVLTSVCAHHVVTSQVLVVGGTGFVGAFTTFSSFTVESFLLWSGGRRDATATNMLLTVVVGLGVAAAGLAVGATVA
jgi:fluoride exporter